MTQPFGEGGTTAAFEECLAAFRPTVVSVNTTIPMGFYEPYDTSEAWERLLTAHRRDQEEW